MNKNEDPKNKLPKKGEKKTAEKAEKHSPGFLEKTKERIVTAVDQNKDGRIDVKDLTSVSRRWSEKRETSKREAEINLLRPLFEDDLEAPEFNMPKMIRLVGMDKRHAESEVCIGSIGHESDYKGLRIVNIYPEYLHSFGLTFYPDLDNEVYYVDPCDRNHYIALDEYFNYLKIARLSELQKIAQDLGAKHFRVTYKEYAQSSSKKQALAKAAVKTIAGETAKMNAEHSVVENNASKVEIAAEMHFLGHQPAKLYRCILSVAVFRVLTIQQGTDDRFIFKRNGTKAQCPVHVEVLNNDQLIPLVFVGILLLPASFIFLIGLNLAVFKQILIAVVVADIASWYPDPDGLRFVVALQRSKRCENSKQRLHSCLYPLCRN